MLGRGVLEWTHEGVDIGVFSACKRKEKKLKCPC